MTPVAAGLFVSLLESLVWMVPPHAADVVTMERLRPGVGRGYIVDGNLMLGENPSLARTLTVKLPLTVAMVWGDHELGKRDKKLQWAGRVVVYCAYGYIAVRHERMRRESRHGR